MDQNIKNYPYCGQYICRLYSTDVTSQNLERWRSVIRISYWSVLYENLIIIILFKPSQMGRWFRLWVKAFLPIYAGYGQTFFNRFDVTYVCGFKSSWFISPLPNYQVNTMYQVISDKQTAPYFSHVQEYRNQGRFSSLALQSVVCFISKLIRWNINITINWYFFMSL